MPEIPEINIRQIQIKEPRVPALNELPNVDVIPSPINLNIDLSKPVINLPCVQAREDYTSKEVFNFDKDGHTTYCDMQTGAFAPPDFNPSTLSTLKAPTQEETKAKADEQVMKNIDSMRSELEELTDKKETKKETKKEKKETNQKKVNIPKNLKLNDLQKQSLDLALSMQTQCPPIDALPISALGPQQTKRVKGYVRDDYGECVTIWEDISFIELAQNFTPPGSQVLSVAATTFVSATVVLAAKPASSILLKIVKPLIKKVSKKVFKILGKSQKTLSYNERLLAQRERNRAIIALRRSLPK